MRVVIPPEESRARLWLKLLLYLTGVGLGELDVDVAAILSDASDPALRPATDTGAADGAILSSVNEPSVGTRAEVVLGEPASGETPRGDADNVGVLNGWTENELLRFVAVALRGFLELDAADICCLAGSGVGGELALKS